MIENLQAYLDLNDIQPQKALLAAGKVIEANPDKSVLNLSRSGYILEAFHDLIAKKIQLEEFMIMGDEGSERKIYTYTLIDDPDIYLATRCEVDKQACTDKIILIDSLVGAPTKKLVESNNSILLTL